MFFIRSDDTVTVIARGKPYTVANDHPQYDQINKAIAAGDEERIYAIVTSTSFLQRCMGVFGAVKVYGGHVTVDDQPVHNYLVGRILATEGDVSPLANFLNLVSHNPSRRAVQDLYDWCEKARLPLSPDGHIIAYKMVGPTFLDLHTGTIDNTPGRIVEMPRNQVDDNPERTCSHGLHFCAASYLSGSGGGGNKIILVKVNPADVVAFPIDYSLTKARCCRYEVLQEIPGVDFFDDYNELSWEPELTDEQRVARIEAPLGFDHSELTLNHRIAYLEGHFGLYSSVDDPVEARLSQLEEAANV